MAISSREYHINSIASKIRFQIDQQSRITAFFRPPHIENLVIEGGGPRGTVYVDAYAELVKSGVINQLKRVAGSSAGAITAVLIGLGLSPEEIHQFATRMNYSILQDISHEDLSGQFGEIKKIIHEVDNLFAKESGLYLGEVFLGLMRVLIRDQIESLINKLLVAEQNPEQKIAILQKMIEIGLVKEINTETQNFILVETITFKHVGDLASAYPQLGLKDIFITGTNYTKQSVEVFSQDSEPDMEIALAVRISMSIPMIYKMVKYKGSHYVDGGCLDNFPVTIFEELRYRSNQETIVLGHYNQNLCTLGLRVDDKEEMRYLFWEKPETFFERLIDMISDASIRNNRQKLLNKVFEEFNSTFNHYLADIKNKLMGLAVPRINMQRAYEASNEEVRQKYPHRVIQIDDHGYTLTQFDLNEEQMHELMEAGAFAARQWLKLHEEELIHKTYSSCTEMHPSELRTFIDQLKEERVELQDLFHDQHLRERFDEDLKIMREQFLYQANRILEPPPATAFHSQFFSNPGRRVVDPAVLPINTEMHLESATSLVDTTAPIETDIIDVTAPLETDIIDITASTDTDIIDVAALIDTDIIDVAAPTNRMRP